MQIEEEILQLRSLSRRLLSLDLSDKYEYTERSIKLLRAASKQKSDLPQTRAHPILTKSEEVI
jgi:hypothetical protein